MFMDGLGIHDVHKRISNFPEHCLALKEDKSVNYVSHDRGQGWHRILQMSFHEFPFILR